MLSKKAMPFANNAHSKGVVIKLENGKTVPILNGAAQQKSKKLYAPNLNVVRQKNKDKEIAKKTIEKNKNIIATRNNHRNAKVEGRFIQSQGVFSDGTGEMKRLVRTYNGDSERQSNGRASVGDCMLRPKLELNDRKVDTGAEASVVNNLLDCDDFNPLDSFSRDYEPIVLPLSSNIKPFLDIFCVTPKVVKQEKINQEKETVRDGCANILVDPQEVLHDAPNFLKVGKYTDDDPFISLIRLPDSFPAKGFSDSKSNGISDNANEKEKGQPEHAECIDFNARMFNEGQLGRIIVRQSGKIEIQIGSGSFLLQSSGESSCAEEVMIIPNEPRGDSEINCKDEMIVLGDVREHLTLSPSWQQLYIDKMNKTKHFGHYTS